MSMMNKRPENEEEGGRETTERERGASSDLPPEGKRAYKIRLKVLNRETGITRDVDIAEARAWDWDNPEVWRIIGGWQIRSFQQLLNVLYMKMEKGCKEVVILEAPRFTMLAGG